MGGERAPNRELFLLCVAELSRPVIVAHPNCRCPLWVRSRHVQCKKACPLSAINVRFASRRTAAKFASLFDEAGGGVRDMTEVDQTGEHA